MHFSYKGGFYDGAEIMNVGKDAVEAFLNNKGGRIAVEACDSLLPSVQDFMRAGETVSLVLLQVFEEKLGLPKGALVGLHGAKGGSGAR